MTCKQDDYGLITIADTEKKTKLKILSSCNSHDAEKVLQKLRTTSHKSVDNIRRICNELGFGCPFCLAIMLKEHYIAMKQEKSEYDDNTPFDTRIEGTCFKNFFEPEYHPFAYPKNSAVYYQVRNHTGEKHPAYKGLNRNAQLYTKISQPHKEKLDKIKETTGITYADFIESQIDLFYLNLA